MQRTDAVLLEALQRDSSRSIAQLAELAGMSASACHRRVRALEEQGLISGYAARVEPRALGLAVEEDAHEDADGNVWRIAPRPVPLPPRLSQDEIARHRAFVSTLGDEAIWWNYLERSEAEASAS